MKAVVHTDGASLGNPGPSGIGVVIRAGGRTVKVSEHIGVGTNNRAEYSALIRGLEEAMKLGATEIELNLDSELVVKHLKGEYRVKDAGLKPLFLKAAALIGSFKAYTIRHVPREENTEADRLSKKGAERASLEKAHPGGGRVASEKRDRHIDGRPAGGPQRKLPF